MARDGSDRDPLTGLSDGALWRRSRAMETAEDEAARFMDLASFADRLLDSDEQERIAERLAEDPAATTDVAAARALAGAAASWGAPPEAVVARACALIGGGNAAGENVVRFVARRRPMQVLAQWASLAAALLVASWLGFTLGVDASGSLGPNGRGDDGGVLNELLDPATNLIRDLTEGAQT